MIKRLLQIIVLLTITISANCQVSFSNGSTVTEIQTATVVTYNHRFYDSTERNHKKNGPALDDARIAIESRSSKFEFKFEFDLAVMGNAVLDPTAPPITEAYFVYKGLNFVNIKTGFSKIPFSRDNLQEHFDMPFMSRPELDKSTIFARRDVGVTLYRTFWNEKINAYAGMYSGQGESVLTTMNDASGSAEFAGRVDVSYPCKYKYIQVDEVHSPIPIIQVGLNARYINKPVATGYGNSVFADLNHEKSIMGFDVSGAYQGFTFQVEMDQAKIVPNNISQLDGFPTTYYRTGGATIQLNYHSKLLRSVFAVRYDELNPNDLTQDDTRKAVSFAYNYLINSYRCALKVQYTTPFSHFTKDAESALAGFDPQLSVAWQYWFR